MRTSLKILLVTLLFVVLTVSANAQERFGPDSAECVKNLSLYKEFVKQKNYKDALFGWRIVFKICPESSRNLYSDGIKIWDYLIQKEKNEEIKQKMIDTLLMVYDQRIVYFGNVDKYSEGWILGRKGNDMYSYRPDKYEESYLCLAKSIKMQGNDAEEGTVTPFMLTSIEMYKNGKHGAEQVVDDYVKASDIIDFNINATNESDLEPDKKTDKIDKLNRAKENLDNLFVKSEPATCERIIPIFQPKFEAAQDDIELIKKIVKLLNRQDCTEGEFFYNVSIKLNQLEPSAMASYALAKMSLKKEKYKEAGEFYKKAIDLEIFDTLKAQYYIELAAITGTKLGNKGAGKTYALEAARLKSNWGVPYILIAQLYAGSASSCGENSFEKKTAYWAAVDKLAHAKAIDPSCAEDANKLIGAYQAQYPNKEDAFFYNVTEGQSYTVGCWINETTTARF